MPIGSGAVYAKVAKLTGASEPAGITTTQWTSGIVIATTADPEVSVLTNGGTAAMPGGDNWDYLNDGGAQCGVSGSKENNFLSKSSDSSGLSFNPWSTPPNGTYTASPLNFTATAYFPTGYCPSPDTDGLMTVFQPDGYALDTFATVTLANGDIVSSFIATFIDTTGDGAGDQNGRRASMIPSFAGMIRNGEIASGTIPHALAVTMDPAILTANAVWPAYSYDTNNNYTGSLPMGALLAIPPSVNLSSLGLSAKGLILAKAAQNYGVYVVDRGGSGVTFQVQESDPDASGWSNAGSDATIIVKNLERVMNNRASNIGGGGTLRAPLAPPF